MFIGQQKFFPPLHQPAMTQGILRKEVTVFLKLLQLTLPFPPSDAWYLTGLQLCPASYISHRFCLLWTQLLA